MSLEPLPDLPCACATARRTARVLTQFYGSHMRSAQLEPSQFGLLSILDKRPGSTQEGIARLLAFDKTTLSRNLKLLKNNGWIEPAPAQDRRVRGFRLTNTGRQRLNAARAGWNKAQAQLRSKLSPEQWEGMWSAFRVLTEAARDAQIAVDEA